MSDEREFGESEQPTRSDPAASRPESPEPGQERLGDFKLLRKIGRGGMGVVYEAEQISMRRRVALKLLDGGFLPSDDQVARFEREAWIGGRLSHPNIVQVHAQGAEGNTHYIAMELLGGLSLHELLREKRKDAAAQRQSSPSLQASEIHHMVQLFVGLAGGLEQVHRQGIVHRDIKPGNLLFDAERSRLLLSDFGLARDVEASRLTRRGDFLGTVPYMSPEQLLASRVELDPRSDIYSLGVSLYEAVTLALPYAANSEEAYLRAISSSDPLPARARSRTVPRDLETILLCCLERAPERRYSSAAKLRDDLVRFLEGRPVEARRPGLLIKGVRLAGRNRVALVTGLVAVAVTAAVLGGVWSTRGGRDTDQRIRRALELAIATGATPAESDVDWERLQPELSARLDADPDGELVRLALRATRRVRADLPPFGLLEDSPPLRLELDTMFEADRPYVVATHVEGSWDGAGWQPLGRCYAAIVDPGAERRWLGSMGPERATSGLAAGPHLLDLRARYVFFDPLQRPDRTQSGEGCSMGPYDPDEIRRIWGEPLFTEARPLPSLSITLFEEYPDDFPVAVEDPTGVLEDSFRVTRVVVGRLAVPEGEGEWIAFGPLAPHDHRAERWCIRLQDPSVRNLLTNLTLEGRMDSSAATPVVAHAVLRRESDGAPIQDFDLLLGAGRFSIVDLRETSHSERGDDGSLTQLAGGVRESFRPLPAWVADGTLAGRLELTPSRELAIANHQPRFLAGEAVMAVQIEFRSVQGERVEADGCGAG